MKRIMCIVLGLLVAAMPLSALAEGDIYGAVNWNKVILPSSQYTPNKPYQAMVWVHNTGQRYTDTRYNYIWATPPTDAQGRQWFDPEYSTEGISKWVSATAPFSSDEYYKSQKSYRWVTSDIMAEMYMRRSFTLNAPLEGKVFLACGHDDAPAEWYINGVKVHSVADGWNNDEYIELTDEQAALIKTDGSENILAVHVHQNWGGAFADCGLYGSDMYRAKKYLPTVEKGEWNCCYYILNYNSDLTAAENAKWASLGEDESDWIEGVGPFSNDQNMFYITEWPSQVRPLLVRRHFNLTKADLQAIEKGVLELTCSYDENPKVYLNGTLIWSTTGWNDNEYAKVTLTAQQKKLFVEGDNVLAVSVAQGGGGGHIDYGISIVEEYISHVKTPIVGIKINHPGVYTLSGQYLGETVENLGEGLYIVNGEKQLIKK